MYQFRYMLNDHDYLEFNKHHLLNAPANKKAWRIMRPIAPIIFSIILLVSVLNGDDLPVIIAQLVVYTIASVMWIFVAKPYGMFFMKLSIKRMKKDGKLPYGKDVWLCFEEDFLIETTTETEAKMKYTNLERIEVGKNAVYIYISAIQALIIPFYAFESNEQKEALLAFLNGKK